MLGAIEKLLLAKYACFAIQCGVLLLGPRMGEVLREVPAPGAALLVVQWLLVIGLIKSLGVHSGAERQTVAAIHSAYFRANAEGRLDPAAAVYAACLRQLRAIHVRRVAAPRSLLSEYLHFCVVPDLAVAAAVLLLGCFGAGRLSEIWRVFFVGDALFRSWAYVAVCQNRMCGWRRRVFLLASLPAQVWVTAAGLSLAAGMRSREEVLAAAFGAWLLAELCRPLGCCAPLLGLRGLLYASLRN